MRIKCLHVLLGLEMHTQESLGINYEELTTPVASLTHHAKQCVTGFSNVMNTTIFPSNIIVSATPCSM